MSAVDDTLLFIRTSVKSDFKLELFLFFYCLKPKSRILIKKSLSVMRTREKSVYLGGLKITNIDYTQIPSHCFMKTSQKSA